MKTDQLIACIGACVSCTPWKQPKISRNSTGTIPMLPNFEDVNLWIILGILPSKKSLNLSHMIFPGISQDISKEWRDLDEGHPDHTRDLMK